MDQHVCRLDADADDPCQLHGPSRCDPCCGACSSRSRRASSISLICSSTKRRCAMSRCSSASVFGGSGHALRRAQRRKPLRRFAQFRVEATDAEARQTLPSSGSRCACARRPGSRARGSGAWHPPPRSLGSRPWCNASVSPRSQPRKDALEQARYRAGRSSPADARATPRRSSDG